MYFTRFSPLTSSLSNQRGCDGGQLGEPAGLARMKGPHAGRRHLLGSLLPGRFHQDSRFIRDDLADEMEQIICMIFL